tara:strand:- start:12563 stop:12775 length:213 start_codon:yes stop_codon:yes gene_type:complete
MNWGIRMSTKKDTSKTTESKKDQSKLKIHKDFMEFGRITSEDLNDFFDNDVMSSLTASAKRMRERRMRRR